MKTTEHKTVLDAVCTSRKKTTGERTVSWRIARSKRSPTSKDNHSRKSPERRGLICWQNESKASVDKMPRRKERARQGHFLQDRTMVVTVRVKTLGA